MRTKLRWFLPIIVVAVLAVLLIVDSVRHMEDWDPKPSPAVENAETVQDWATSSYGVSVEDREAKGMAREILGKATRTDQTLHGRSPTASGSEADGNRGRDIPYGPHARRAQAPRSPELTADLAPVRTHRFHE